MVANATDPLTAAEIAQFEADITAGLARSSGNPANMETVMKAELATWRNLQNIMFWGSWSVREWHQRLVTLARHIGVSHVPASDSGPFTSREIDFYNTEIERALASSSASSSARTQIINSLKRLTDTARTESAAIGYSSRDTRGIHEYLVDLARDMGAAGKRFEGGDGGLPQENLDFSLVADPENLHVDGSRRFNGTTDWFTIVDNPAVRAADNGELAILTWAYPEDLGGNQRFFSKNSGGGTEAELEFGLGMATSQFVLLASNGTTQTNLFHDTFGAITLSRWYCVIAWWDASDGMLHLEVNGNEVTPIPHAGGFHNASGSPLVVGSNLDAVSLLYTGRLSTSILLQRPPTAQERIDFRALGNGLRQYEIDMHPTLQQRSEGWDFLDADAQTINSYSGNNDGAPTGTSTAEAGPNSQNTVDDAGLAPGVIVGGDLVGMSSDDTPDQSFEPLIYDKSGAQRDGLIQRFLDYTAARDAADVPAAVGSGSSLHIAAAPNQVLIQDDPALDLIGVDFTIAMWLKVEGFTAGVGHALGFYDVGAAANGWAFAVNNLTGALNFWDGTAWRLDDQDINDGAWHHVGVTFTGGLVQFWVDGSGGTGVVSPGIANPFRGSKRLGTRADGQSDGGLLGKYDNVEIHLGAWDQFNFLHRWSGGQFGNPPTENPLLSYDFDEGPRDLLSEDLGESVRFAGAQSIQCGRTAHLDWGTGDGTVGVWARVPTATGGSQTMVYKGRNDGARTALQMSGTGQLNFVVNDGTGGVTTVSTVDTMADDLWHLLIGVRDTQAGVLRLYQDGRKVAEAADGSGDADNAVGELNFGAEHRTGAPALFLDGAMDTVVWDTRAYTDEEILAIATGGVRGSLASAPAGRWAFDDTPFRTVASFKNLVVGWSYRHGDGDRTVLRQITPGNRPSYFDGLINGQPALQLFGHNLAIRRQLLTSLEGTIAMVGSLFGASPGMIAFSQSGIVAPENVFAPYNINPAGGAFNSIQYEQSAVNHQVAGDTPFAFVTPVLIIVSGNGTRWRMRINGIEQTLTPIVGADVGQWFGANTDIVWTTVGGLRREDGDDAGDLFIGSLAELHHWNVEQDDAQLERIEDVLLGKYNLIPGELSVDPQAAALVP